MPPIVIVGIALALASTGIEIGLQSAAASTTTGSRVLNRNFSTSTYGTPIERCRGTVRLTGNLVWSTEIIETLYDKSTGKSDIHSFGYSASLAVAFGRGPCTELISLWTDGKRLYSAKVGNATIAGTVTLIASAQQPALQGATTITVQTGSGSALYLEAGAIIQWPSTDDNSDYEVEQDVTLGPNQTGQIQIWPPLISSKIANAPLLVPGASGDTLDQSDFTYDPQIGVPAAEGPRFTRLAALTFYPGSTTQVPDPVLEEYLGAGNVPGYRELIYCVIDQLELANFGNRIPSFTAEIAFDGTSPGLPLIGPIAGILFPPTQVIIPSEVSSEGVTASPFVVAYSPTDINGNAHIQIINAGTNTLVTEWAISGPAS